MSREAERVKAAHAAEMQSLRAATDENIAALSNAKEAVEAKVRALQTEVAAAESTAEAAKREGRSNGAGVGGACGPQCVGARTVLQAEVTSLQQCVSVAESRSLRLDVEAKSAVEKAGAAEKQVVDLQSQVLSRNNTCVHNIFHAVSGQGAAATCTPLV